MMQLLELLKLSDFDYLVDVISDALYDAEFAQEPRALSIAYELMKHFNLDRILKPHEMAVGTVVIFPRVRDQYHETSLAIRWADSFSDESLPWLILGSEGPQYLSNESVEDCEILTVVRLENNAD